MRLDAVPLVVFLVGSSLERSKGDGYTAYEPRRLQEQTFLYRSSYNAEFQHLTDVGCDGAPPVVLVTCLGSSLTILNTSDDSILCQRLDVPRIPNGTTFQCLNSCNGTACQNVYRFIPTDSTGPQQGPFGSVSFLCQGNAIDEVGAGMDVVGGTTFGTGTCLASDVATRGRNIRFGRLGVSCPVAGSAARQYVFDDTYADCLSEETFSVDLSPGESSGQDVLTCATGATCQGQACDFSFPDLLVTSSLANFYDTCVESSVPITSFPTAAPVDSLFEYFVSFEASWGQLYNSFETYLACSSMSPEVLISCENGARIEYVNSTDANMICNTVLGNQLSCRGDEGSGKNSLISVFYNCVGPNLPSSRVTYPDATVTCTNIATSSFVRNAVTLGVSCVSENVTFFFNDNLLFECGEASDDFEYISDKTVVENPRYSCGSLATFAISSSTTEQTLGNVSVVTNDLWLSKQFMNCFTLNSDVAPSVPTTNTVTVAPSPIQAPVTVPASTTPSSNQSPVPAPTTPSSNQSPVSAPTMPSSNQSPVVASSTQSPNPTVSRIGNDALPAASNEGKSDTGIWVGLFVGGVTTGILLVAGLVFLQRRKKRPPANLSVVEESIVLSSPTEPSGPATPPPPLPTQPSVKFSTRNRRTVHRVGSEVAVIENPSLAVVLEVSDITNSRAEPSGIYEGYEA